MVSVICVTLYYNFLLESSINEIISLIYDTMGLIVLDFL
jgi:hypothetical protein